MITIKEALTTLSNGDTINNANLRHDQRDAIKLGIKALERIQRLRAAGHYVGMPLLKGEKQE